MQQRHYLKILALVILCVSLLLGVSWLPLAGKAPTASAHAFVIGSDPIDGSTINKPPSVVRIYFDAPISATSQASVYAFAPGSSNGLLVSANHGTVNTANARELDIPLLPANKLPQGGYEVNWTALSLNDGHTTSGLIGFNFGASNTGTAGTPTLGPSTSNHFPQLGMQGALSVAWDWLVTLALLFWVGILVTEVLIIPAALEATLLARTRKHSRSLQALCLAGLLVGEGINLILRTTSFTQTLGGSGINLDILAPFVLNTNYGHLWLVRVTLLIVALAFFWWSSERRQASASNTPATRNSKRTRQLGQLRLQARAETTSATTGTSLPALSTLTPSQARVSGAITANVSQARSTTASQPRITLRDEQTEAPLYQLSFWHNMSWLALAGLIVLALVLSNELLQLAPLPISAGLFSWLSLISQALWFGCIAYLGFTLLPLLPDTNADQYAETLIRVLKRARPFLLSAIGVFLACELFLSEVAIQTPDQLFSEPYGRALLVRELLLVLMLILTGYILFYLLPKLQRQTTLLPVVAAEMPARRTRTVELEKTEHAIKQALRAFSGLAAITLICLALMNFFAPPVVFPNINYASPVTSSTPPTPTSQSQTVDGLTATLNVSPARTGTTNTVQLTLKDAQGNAVSNATVKLTLNMQIMDMGTTSATIKGGGTTYTTTFSPNQTFTMAGAWLIHIEIDRPGQTAALATFQITVA